MLRTLFRKFNNPNQNKKSIKNENEHRFSNSPYNDDGLTNKEKFDNILNFAHKILDSDVNENEHSILDFIRILGRRLQSEYISYMLYTSKNESPFCNLGPREILFPTSTFLDNNKYISISKLIKEVDRKDKISLSKDLILPWPWRKDRIENCILNIGEGKKWGKWKQDQYNHRVTVWLPMGIAWVSGGNHSISVGIVQGGEIEPDYYEDISELYKHIKCDGENFLSMNDNNIICTVNSPEFAAIFEIGRIMVKKGISF